MKHNCLYIIAALLVFGTLAFAGKTGTITGKIIDPETHEPLPGAVITILELNKTTNTNLKGVFTFNDIPVGVYSLRVKMMGYSTVTRSNIIVIAERKTICDFGGSETRIFGEAQNLTNNLKSTIITPHLEEHIVNGVNIIYCATFQIAWNKLQDKIIKEPINIEGVVDEALILNKQLLKGKDLDKNSYVAEAGPQTQDLIDRVNDELKAKFGSAGPALDISPDINSIFSYCYLYKNLKFKEKFNILKRPIRFCSNDSINEVASFGINEDSSDAFEKLSKQVKILYYNDDDDFAVKLITKNQNDELILLKKAPLRTIRELIESVQNNRSFKNTNMAEEDRIAIPYTNFDITHEFGQFTNKHLLNAGWTGWAITKAKQKIKFELNEAGAILESFALIQMGIGGHVVNIKKKPKRLIFDKPFLIMLRKKGSKLPYFAMWVGNAELLGKY